MSLDLRIPMGLMFTLVGIILTAFGFATNSNAALYERSMGINVNLWWGIVLLIFGQIMFQMGRRSQSRLAKLPPPPPDAPEVRRGH
jgi:Na+/melibiose symporter-like transporter